jgi:6-phosphofructokinase 1
MLATRYGTGAIDVVHKGESGRMVALKGTDIVSIPIAEAIGKTRLVGDDLIDVALGLHEKMEKTVA